MKSSASKIQLTGFDDLFHTGGKAEADDERVQEIPLTELFPFKNHPFQVRDDEAMRKTAESIAKYGVLIPGIVRPRTASGYEIVAGRRRKRGRELAGRETMQDVLDAYGKSNEEFSAVLRCFMEIASIMASSGLPPRRV